MASALIQVADAIVTELAAGDFVLAIEPTRSYAEWDLELDDAGVLHVDVVPVSHATSELDDRDHVYYRCQVDIGIRKRFEVQENSGRIERAEIDDLVELVEDIHEYLAGNNGRRLTNYTSATWEETSIRNTYVREHLRQMRQFTGIIGVVYSVTVAV